MDNKTIEKFAAIAVTENILDIDVFHPNITENDKTVSWDGFIEVYKSNNKIKSNLDGKVDVQVKGTMNNNHSKVISYPVETDDLRNYLNNGGVIYFVVRIHKERTLERKVYYEALTQVKTKQYLDEAKKQKTKSIKFKEFPIDKNERISIVINFLQNSRRQSSYVESGFIPIEDILKGRYQYTIPFLDYKKSDINPLLSTIVGKEVYAYVITKGSSALIPIDTPLTINEVSHKTGRKIYIGDICYYDNCEWVITSQGMSVKIGDSLKLMFGKGEHVTVKVNIDLHFSPYLRKAAQDMRFIIDALNAKQFSIDKMPLRLDSLNLETLTFIPVIKKRLIFFEKIIKLFNILNVEEDLNINNLTNDERNHIDVLIKSLVEKEPITNIATDNLSVLDLKLSNILLKLLILKNEDGSHTIYDFFNSTIAVSYKDGKGNNQVTSPYSALSKDDYLIVSNINYDHILDSYKNAFTLNPDVYNRANLDMLQMLLAYDKKENNKLLSVAKDLAFWILSENMDSSKNIHILNYLQIIKRERQLDNDERMQLCEITEDANATKQEKVGAYLLLENNDMAENHFKKLTTIDQETFKLFPIFRFWKLSKGGYSTK